MTSSKRHKHVKLLQSHKYVTRLEINPKSVPHDSKIDTIEVKIVNMTEELAKFWHEKYQGKIKNQNRSDAKWNWKHLWNIYNSIFKHRKEDYIAYSLIAKGDANKAILLGMMLAATKYPAINANTTDKKRTFIWYLASYPKAYHSTKTPGEPKGVGGALIDASLIRNYHANGEHSVSLRSDPKGGEGLKDHYKTLGFIEIKNPKLKLPRKAVTGKHNYLTMPEKAASKHIQNHNKFRK